MTTLRRLGFLLLLLVAGLSEVKCSPSLDEKGFGPGDQDWGHVDVREGAHMFYWLYFVQDPQVKYYNERPLVIWLQGGPGGSSTGFGNFEEIGPLYLNGTERPSSWAKHVNLLFIDNPVGAGFSYVDDYRFLTKTNAEIGKDMVSFLKNFYEKYPEFVETPLYIYSESYGGKMAVEMAQQILSAVDANKLNTNLKGVGLIDSWISPIDSVMTWAPFLYHMGMVDEKSLKRITEGAKEVEKAVNEENFSRATSLWSDLEMVIISETHNIDFYNVLYKVKAEFAKKHRSKELLTEFPLDKEFDDDALQRLMEGPVKKALNIPSKVVHNKQSGAVFKYLSGDFMKPVIHVVEDLLNNTNLQVVVVTGNLDLIVDSIGTVEWVNKMQWDGAHKWENAPRNPLYIDGYIEGYVKNVKNLHFYWVHRAGHMVPSDNPEAALEILRRSTNYDEFY